MAGALGLKPVAQAYIITLVQMAIRIRAIIMILDRVRVFQSITKSPPVSTQREKDSLDFLFEHTGKTVRIPNQYGQTGSRTCATRNELSGVLSSHMWTE
jgi:hypothetical protein